MDQVVLEEMLTFVAGIVAMGCLTGVIITWIRARAGKQVRTPELTGRLDEIAARLGALDHAVDTMAVEVERIAEGQRFVARVLAERSSVAVLSEKAKVGSTTPH